MNNEQNQLQSTENRITLNNREHVEITGVEYVETFDEHEIILNSVLGGMAVEGDNLKIISFSIDSGKLYVCGKINGIFYFSQSGENKSGFFGKRKK